MADYQDWQGDDDSEEEEEDFIPGADDDGDYDLEPEDDDLDNDDPSAIPSFLEGRLFMDPAKGALCYEQEGVFCLVCQSTLPSKTFDFQAPPLGNPLMFAGWMQNPSNWMEFMVEFSRQAASDDPLEEKLLKAQDEKNAEAARSKGKSTGLAKSEDSSDNDGKVAASKSGNLKAPPSYSTNGEAAKDNSNLKSPPSYSLESTKAGSSAINDKDALIVMSGTQVQDGNDDSGRSITFRGAYRLLVDASVEKLCVIASVQVVEASSATAAAGGGASSEGAAAGASAPPVAAAAAASRKRRRGGEDDDDSVEGRGGVEYQELIDLHDDAGLSTEELRKRYYGNAGTGQQNNQATNDSAKPAAKMAATGEKEDSKPFGGAKDNESEDDDDYGF